MPLYRVDFEFSVPYIDEYYDDEADEYVEFEAEDRAEDYIVIEADDTNQAVLRAEDELFGYDSLSVGAARLVKDDE